MTPNTLLALSPLDGRYAEKLVGLRTIFSEYALIKQRLKIEIEWLAVLASNENIPELPAFSAETQRVLRSVYETFSERDAQVVKDTENTTRHDVKAVEYYVKDRLPEVLDGKTAAIAVEFVHFACTSEDINNLAYALMLKEARQTMLLEKIDAIKNKLQDMARRFAEVPMLSRTHGQPATPTTVGKEFANFAHRLSKQRATFERVEIFGKINGAVGNYNAHALAYPEVDWQRLARDFVQDLGLSHNSHTAQIEPHDFIAEYCDALKRVNTILLDFCKDIWGYISLGYFKQKISEGQVGSSTMPHKINPIDFENAEGNLGLANALLGFFAEKLPISRWQRDLSDSTVLRNLGVAFGHAVLAYDAIAAGLGKLELNESAVACDLDAAWEVLAEAVQTVMRKHGLPEPYERLKDLTQGSGITKESLRSFVQSLDLPEADKRKLLDLTPGAYIGLAPPLAKRIEP